MCVSVQLSYLILVLLFFLFPSSSFQELDLRAEALVLNETDREKDWVKNVEDALGPSYVQVSSSFDWRNMSCVLG